MLADNIRMMPQRTKVMVTNVRAIRAMSPNSLLKYPSRIFE